MPRRFLIFISIALLLLAACVQTSPITPTPTPSSGIQGNVTEGPTCPGPVPIGGTQCQDQPYQATVQVLNSAENIVKQFQTDENGYFKVSLPPGMYILHPLSGQPFPHAVDQTVWVTANQYTQVTIMYDTGIR
jgi:hypothetical protein